MKKILLIGKAGQVGHELISALAPLGHVTAVGREQLDLTRHDSIVGCIRDIKPDLIVNAAGYTSVDGAESVPELTMQVNATAPGILAQEAKRSGALLVHYSTDYVFDGSRDQPYAEEDAPNPVNIYGKSKLEGEHLIARSGCQHLILRASWIYSSRGTNFVLTMLKLARENPSLRVVDDQIGSPCWARTLALATAELLGKWIPATTVSGIYHFSAPDYVSRLEFARKIVGLAQEFSGNPGGWARIEPTTTADYPLPAARPLNASTSKDKLKSAFSLVMPGWEAQLEAFLRNYFQTTKHTTRP